MHMINSKVIFLILVSLVFCANGCQSTHKTLELSANVNLYDLPEEEGGKIVYVTKRKVICHIETTQILKMYRYYKLNCDGVSGWLIDGDQT